MVIGYFCTVSYPTWLRFKGKVLVYHNTIREKNAYAVFTLSQIFKRYFENYRTFFDLITFLQGIYATMIFFLKFLKIFHKVVRIRNRSRNS